MCCCCVFTDLSVLIFCQQDVESVAAKVQQQCIWYLPPSFISSMMIPSPTTFLISITDHVLQLLASCLHGSCMLSIIYDIRVMFYVFLFSAFFPSVLWRCWLGGRKGIRPVKTEWWGAGMVICLERGADLHMAQLIPLPPTVSCFSKIQIGFYLSGTGLPG